MPDTSPLPPVDRSSLPRWPQFGMRALFMFVTACCMLFALAGLVGHLWALAVAWLVLMTAVHVAANVWGTRLSKVHSSNANLDNPIDAPWRGNPPRAIVCAPTTGLGQRAALGWTMVVVTVLGATLGGPLGAAVLWLVAWGRIDYGSLGVAGVSAAVLGGFVGFLASSFLEVALRAWWEATAAVARSGNANRSRQ